MMDCSAPPARAGDYIMYSKLKGGGIVTRQSLLLSIITITPLFYLLFISHSFLLSTPSHSSSSSHVLP